MDLFRRLILSASAGLMLAACATTSQFPQSTATASSTPLPIIVASTPSAEPPRGATADATPTGRLPALADQGGIDIALFSPDGQTVALASNGTVTLWDVRTGRPLRQLQNPYSSATPSSASFSLDGAVFGVSAWQYHPNDTPGVSDLVIWDVATGNVLAHWTQASADMPNTSFPNNPYWIPVPAFAFLPNSSRMVFSNGHHLEIRDFRRDVAPITIDLGPQMFASQLSVPPDGRFVYALMDWRKDHDWPIDYTEQYKVQIWDAATYGLRREIRYPVRKYPDIWWATEYALHGPNVMEFNYTQGTYRAISLENGRIANLPYRTGTRYVSSDLGFVVFARLYGVDDRDRAIELWNADTWRELYTFWPPYALHSENGNDHITISGIAFSPDSTLLAIAHEGQISFVDIRQFTNP